MSDLKPEIITLKLGKKEYGLSFTLNVIDDLQDHFDIEIAKLTELFNDEKTIFRNLRWLVTRLINEGLDCKSDETGEKYEHLTEGFVGRNITPDNIQALSNAILASFAAGTPKNDDPNL